MIPQCSGCGIWEIKLACENPKQCSCWTNGVLSVVEQKFYERNYISARFTCALQNLIAIRFFALLFCFFFPNAVVVCRLSNILSFFPHRGSFVFMKIEIAKFRSENIHNDTKTRKVTFRKSSRIILVQDVFASTVSHFEILKQIGLNGGAQIKIELH